MDPQARCVLYGMIPKCSHMFYLFLVRYDTGFIDAIHALFGAHVDPSLVFYQISEVVSINYFLWDDFQQNAHKFWVWSDIV